MRNILAVLSTLLLTQTAFAADGNAGGGGLQILILVLFFVIFWFLLIRPQMQRSKAHRKMLSELTRGDEVATNGGIVGRIVKVGENFTEIEIASNVVVKVQKNAVANVLPKGSVQTD